MVPRTSWIERSADIVIDELAQFRLVVSRAHVTELIRDRLQAVSSQLHISEQSARRYMDEEALRNLAQNAAVTLADEQPGADVLEQPRTVPTSLQVFSRCISGLAEAAHVRELNGDTESVHDELQLISALALILHEHSKEPAAEPIFLPRAALTRAVRVFAVTADMIRSGTLDAGVADGAGAALADTFDRDAAALGRLLVDGAE